MHMKYSIICLTSTLLQFSIFIASEQLPYAPTDDITLNCGASSDSKDSDGRLWAADKNSKFRPVEKSSENKSEAYEATPGDSSYVLYTTARVSSSEFKYNFPVSPGQKFIRLYFHPASYRNFDRSKAFFTVKAGSFTLLKNFSAALVADSLKVSSFFKEFLLNIVEENQVLDLIFTPSPSVANDTYYAFINGIEIVSMPPNLYYTPPESPDENVPKFIGQNTGYYVNNDTALEMVYRFNVGGQNIAPVNDTGMFRLWSDDFHYALADSYYTSNTTSPLSYTKISRYVAPDLVYETGRTMGPNHTYNVRHNLSWSLEADSDFVYLVRLHFCEFHDLIDEPAERQFEVFIDSQVAENVADVILWAGHSRVPVYKDYVLRLSNNEKTKNKQSINIDLHPRMADYFDVILNGIEVFKLNSSDGNLGGPNPEPVLVPPPPPESPNSAGGKSKTKQRMLIAGGCAIGLLILLSLLTCMYVWRYRKRQCYGKSRGSSFLPEQLCCHFSLEEIKAATNNFHDDLVIGKGGFGKVYQGFLDEGKKTVAIKRLNPESRQGVNEFLTEIEMLSQLRHVHLVPLIGYCYDKYKHEMILVYDFMSNGTLSDHLYGTSYEPLTWKQRLQICKGAAIGLNYLHTEVKHTVIHRDVKTCNILLDDKMTAKVSDFGLSKMDPKVEMIDTAVKGTFGYLDPEYAKGHPLTEKSDVYSFGVVLFEVICARKAVDRKLPESQVNLANWARNCIADGTLYKVIDPYLNGKIASGCFKVFVEIAESCIAEKGVNRPSMNDVMEKLGFAIELQEEADVEQEKMNPGSECSYPDIVFPVARDMDSDDESEMGLGLDSHILSSEIFDTNTTGMTSIIESGTSSDFFSSSNNTKSTVN